MKFESFNKKYRSGKKDNVWQACQNAISIMQNSLDSSHDIKHIENIFGNLDKILSRNRSLKINYDVIVLSVCWHDAWKASSEYKGIKSLLYRQIVEGIASSILFKKNAKRHKLPDKTIKEVTYAIRKHSQIQFLPTRNLEARLLNDADKIDAVNYKRLRNSKLEEIMLTKRIYVKLVIWYFGRRSYKMKCNESLFLFDNSRNDFLSYLKERL